ncbi:hypothetical protein [Hymenobacter lucidus]|uniref:Restriction endonuclease n=1 Tax=Hymenobacter lucidus TaxID=2880930 RepID=A0ABS8AZ41_9BACT|nr:hypothetical protein [Hymenobacter lucidus]MCB2411057.1 hypothetical protein [Hymenobacter lucidus]
MPVAPTKTTTKRRKPAKLSDQEKEILTHIDSIFAALNTTATLLPVSDRGKGNRYEIYLYLRLARLLKRQATTFAPVCKTPGTFLFNESPGTVNDKHSYFAFTHNKEDFELRNGVEFKGHSMNHEVDISISKPLLTGTYGPLQDLRLAIECKYHGKKNNLKGQLRSLAGTVIDLNEYAHGWKSGLYFYYYYYGISFYAFFASQHEVTDTNGYLSYLRNYGIGPLFNFHPSSSDRAAAWRLVQHFLRDPTP